MLCCGFTVMISCNVKLGHWLLLFTILITHLVARYQDVLLLVMSRCLLARKSNMVRGLADHEIRFQEFPKKETNYDTEVGTASVKTNTSCRNIFPKGNVYYSLMPGLMRNVGRDI